MASALQNTLSAEEFNVVPGGHTQNLGTALTASKDSGRAPMVGQERNTDRAR